MIVVYEMLNGLFCLFLEVLFWLLLNVLIAKCERGGNKMQAYMNVCD